MVGYQGQSRTRWYLCITDEKFVRTWFITHVINEGGNVPTSSGWCTVQIFRRWIHPSLTNLEGQLHAQDKLEGSESRVLGIKDVQTVV